MSQNSVPVLKPQLQGVRSKTRKRAVKAQAPHEPITFRGDLLKHLENVDPTDFDAITNKLVQAGSTLDLLKYADALFEILLVGGLLQPGGQYIDDGAPLSQFAIINAKEPVEVADVRQYVEVLNKLIRRYKYLQRPLEENTLPNLMQYMNRWPDAQREKLSFATGLLMAQGLASASCLQSLTKDHLVKNDLSANVLALIFRAYLNKQSMEHLVGTLKRGGIKDLLLFFPPNRRTDKVLDEHFRAAGLAQVAEWWKKRQFASLKDNVVKQLQEMLEHGDSHPDIVAAIKVRQEEQPLPEGELVSCIWQGLISSVEWSARPDQNEALALREIAGFADILEPFCNGAKTEVALINIVQVSCYEEARIMKVFPQILKVLYTADCVSDQAIIHWHQKGSVPQGRQHFLQAAEPLVRFLREEESDDDED